MTLPNRPGYRMQFVKTNQTVVTRDHVPLPLLLLQDIHHHHIRQAARDLAAKQQDVAMVDEVTIEREAHHELLPLIQKLKQMIARPDKLMVALTCDLDDGSESKVSDDHKLLLRKKTIAFQRAALRDLASTWHRFVDTVGSPSSSSSSSNNCSSANAYMKRVDHMMMKLALYYMRLWNYLCAICIDAVDAMRVVVFESQKQWHAMTTLQLERRRTAASISPMFESKSSDALSQNMIRASPSSSALAKRSRLTRQSNEFMIGWFIAHKANPYPSAEERSQIADKTGLTEQQVRNWFANMRKRHWKPNRLNTKKPRCLLDVVLRKHEV